MHGDIRPENIMVTTWNWVVLTDFAVYKPLLIPDDDPTDFQYFFDVMDRRRCYVAPERFSRSRAGISNAMPCPDLGDESCFDMAAKCAMDVFSLGCTIAEVSHTMIIAFYYRRYFWMANPFLIYHQCFNIYRRAKIMGLFQ